jgi:YHS domain-containing protein
MKKLLLILSITLAIFLGNDVFAQQAIRVAQFNTEKGVAIQGYDPVAYFTQGKAVKGTKGLAINAEGITYYFASQEDKDLFKKDYKKYEPQYGGWCAYAMGATDSKVDIDPESFKISNGKLYLFYHSWVNNTLGKWNADERNLQPKADAAWAKFIKRPNDKSPIPMKKIIYTPSEKYTTPVELYKSKIN